MKRPGKKLREIRQRVLVGFDNDTLETLKQRAEENDRSIAGEMRYLVKRALIQLEEKKK